AGFCLGSLRGAGLGWRGMFWAAAATLGVIGLACLFLLKSRPRDVGLSEPEPPRANVFGADTGAGRPESIARLLGPLCASATFWIVCVLSLGMTMIREAFMNWSKHYLHEVVGMEDATAAQASMTFSLVGAASSILAGWASDRLGGNYGRIMVPPIVLLVGALVALAAVPVAGPPA